MKHLPFVIHGHQGEHILYVAVDGKITVDMKEIRKIAHDDNAADFVRSICLAIVGLVDGAKAGEIE